MAPHVDALPLVETRSNGKLRGMQSGNGRYGAAHADPRDAYRDVPILVRPPWNNAIAAYFFFGGVSCGSYVLGSLAGVLGGEKRQPLARTAHYISFSTMLLCPPLLIYDLGRRVRFHHMLRIFKPSSPMNLGAWALTAHGLFATAVAARALADDDRMPVPRDLLRSIPLAGDLIKALPEKPLALAGVPTALTLGGYTGVLLGTSSVPVWFRSHLLGALFMGSAMSTGAAAVVFAQDLTDPEDKGAVRALTPLTLTMGATELVLLGGYIVTSGSAIKDLWRGSERLLSSSATALIGTAVALEAFSATAEDMEPDRERLLSMVASAATLAGGALLRWAVVRAGHRSAADRDETLKSTAPSAQAPGWTPNVV